MKKRDECEMAWKGSGRHDKKDITKCNIRSNIGGYVNLTCNKTRDMEQSFGDIR